MAEGNGNASVNYTVKELLEQAQEKADERHSTTLDAIKGVRRDVQAIDIRVNQLGTRLDDVQAAQKVKDALDLKAEKERDQHRTAKWSRKDRIVAGAGVSAAVIIGLLNTLINLTAHHG